MPCYRCQIYNIYRSSRTFDRRILKRLLLPEAFHRAKPFSNEAVIYVTIESLSCSPRTPLRSCHRDYKYLMKYRPRGGSPWPTAFDVLIKFFYLLPLAISPGVKKASANSGHCIRAAVAFGAIANRCFGAPP